MNKLGIRGIRLPLIVISLSLVSLLVPLQSAYAANISFEFPTNLRTSDSNANPQVASSSTGVHVLFKDLNNIFLSSSKDAGATFNTQDISGTIAPLFTSDHQIFVSGSNVYTLWTDNKIVKFRTSNDDGDTLLPTTHVISSSGSESQTPQIASSSGNAYAIWHDVISGGEDKILFRTVSGAGTTLEAMPPPLGTINEDLGFALASNPQLAAQANKVYAIWQNAGDINFARSIDNGANFEAAKDIGDAGFIASKPQITTEGNNVYAVWREGNNIIYSSSTNMGETFGIGPKTLSTISSGERNSLPQIAVANNIVYVAWMERLGSDFEIKFVKSDNGIDFDATKNLSGTSSTFSEDPQLAASGTDVYVVWKEASTDILAKASSDSGDSFGSVETVSTGLASSAPDIAAGSLFVAWQDFVSGSTWDVLFKKGTIGGPVITFDSSEYKLIDTATITITEEIISGVPSIVATVTSTTDGTGIILTLTPTATPGEYQGSLTFDKDTTDPDNDILKASSGDTITAIFGGNGGTAKIFTAIIEPGPPAIDRSQFLQMSITDQNANVDPLTAETITVHVTSEADPIGIDLTLTETGVDTGIFGGTGNTKLGVMVDEALVTTEQTITITIESSSANKLPLLAETTTALVTSTSDATGITIELTETGDDTGIFEGLLLFGDTSIPGTQIEAVGGDFFTVTAFGGLKSNGMVIPNPNPENGIIKVNPRGTVGGDTLTISYNPTITVAVGNQPAPGGGGGGLVRPGLVVNPLPPDPDDDHYLGYEAKTTKKTPNFQKVTVTLEDQFEQGTYKVEKTKRLFTPVNKNNEGISDDVTHLKGYEIKPFKNSVVLLQGRTAIIEITNQFGTLLLGTEEPTLLLVPTAKDLENPVDELASTIVDHYKCYKVNVIGDFQTREPVTLEDQFLMGTFEVGEPNMLCNPVDKNGEGIINPDNHLVCYVVSENFRKTNIHTHDQFGREILDIEEVKELCVPSEKKLIPEIHLKVIDSDGKRVKDVSCTFSQTTTGGGGGGGTFQGFTTDGKGFANLLVFPVLINGEPVDTTKAIFCSKTDVGSASQIVILDEKLITNITLTLI